MIRFSIVLVLTLLAACASRPISWNTNDYTVKSGDTLYSIAWRYEIDHGDLARWNGLSKSALIYPGQRLHTRKPPGSVASSVTEKRWQPSPPLVRPKEVKSVVVKQDETLYRIATRYGLSVKQLASLNKIKKPYVIRPGQRLKLSAAKEAVASVSKPRSRGQSKGSRQSVSNKTIQWNWPIKGKVIKSFNSRLNDAKGIDIAGKVGKGVKAAAPGKVVYSGNGLISYGNLIIIKHNERYLSAYAHNRKLLVKEGDTVKAGQIIAELGKTGADNPRLHFEIRKNGKPVNPVRYLPSS